MLLLAPLDVEPAPVLVVAVDVDADAFFAAAAAFALALLAAVEVLALPAVGGCGGIVVSFGVVGEFALLEDDEADDAIDPAEDADIDSCVVLPLEWCALFIVAWKDVMYEGRPAVATDDDPPPAALGRREKGMATGEAGEDIRRRSAMRWQSRIGRARERACRRE